MMFGKPDAAEPSQTAEQADAPAKNTLHHPKVAAAGRFASWLMAVACFAAGLAGFLDVLNWVSLDIKTLRALSINAFFIGIFALVLVIIAPSPKSMTPRQVIVQALVAAAVASMAHRIDNDYPDAHLDDAKHCRAVTSCSPQTDLTVAEARSVAIDVMFVSMLAIPLLFLSVYFMLPDKHAARLRKLVTGHKDQPPSVIGSERENLVPVGSSRPDNGTQSSGSYF